MKSKNIAGPCDGEARMSYHKNSNSLSEDNLVGSASSDRNSLDFIIQGTDKIEGVTVSTSYHAVSEDLEKGEMAEGWQYGHGGSSKVGIHARSTDG
jgi:hypothetical protein